MMQGYWTRYQRRSGGYPERVEVDLNFVVTEERFVSEEEFEDFFNRGHRAPAGELPEPPKEIETGRVLTLPAPKEGPE